MSFLDLPGITPQFVAMNRSRTGGAGLDPFEYERVTGPLTSLHDWPAAFREAGLRHHRNAETYERAGRVRSAGEAYRHASRWFHCAGLLPHPDRALAARTAAEADAAMDRAMALLEPDSVRLKGPSFTGRLRLPAGAGDRPPSPVVVIVPGLDSSKEEFHDLADALLARGTAVFAMDGPGQGALAARTTVRADYHRVLTEAVDALESRAEVGAIGVIGLSLGGYYAALGAAHEPRIRAAATVSGPHRLLWDELPPFVTETLAQRAGSPEAAHRFTASVDLRETASRIPCPLLVVDGGQDIVPGAENGELLARDAPHGEYHLVPYGDHLLGNARPAWLPSTADWLTARLA
ncbi:alpha/beta hydrolase family protein [Streptomyces sp. NPDC059989]|uniref:alpha/beta hydrolase family protein n=1 Tax=Streptomyces sp. NPDC059989 TaxID=3347026 RepID=UPI0036B8AE29